MTKKIDRGLWFAVTPAGTLVYETKAKTREECIAALLKLGSHMPYGTWQNFERRGYTIERLSGLAP